MERGRIKIYSGPSLDNELSLDEFIQLVSKDKKDFWTRYIVYKDLRSRGYVVRSGFGDIQLYRKYPRGAKPNKAQSDTLVLPFAEGASLELHQFDLIVNQAASNRKELILGIIDRSGDVTYYKASEYNIKENTERIIPEI